MVTAIMGPLLPCIAYTYCTASRRPGIPLAPSNIGPWGTLESSVIGHILPFCLALPFNILRHIAQQLYSLCLRCTSSTSSISLCILPHSFYRIALISLDIHNLLGIRPPPCVVKMSGFPEGQIDNAERQTDESNSAEESQCRTDRAGPLCTID